MTTERVKMDSDLSPDKKDVQLKINQSAQKYLRQPVCFYRLRACCGDGKKLLTLKRSVLQRAFNWARPVNYHYCKGEIACKNSVKTHSGSSM